MSAGHPHQPQQPDPAGLTPGIQRAGGQEGIDLAGNSYLTGGPAAGRWCLKVRVIEN